MKKPKPDPARIRSAAVRSLAVLFLAAAGAGFFPAGNLAGKEAVLAQTEAPPQAAINLPGDGPCHTQGVTFYDDYLFVSCVEQEAKRAVVYRWRISEGFFAGPSGLALAAGDRIDLTQGQMYHPSGLDHDDQCVWVAVAHYRPLGASSTLICLDPVTTTGIGKWQVPDHIGSVAVMGRDLVLLNWDAKQIYLYSKSGALITKNPSPGNVAYQDCQGVSETSIRCSGPFQVEGRDAAVVDLLVFDPKHAKRWQIGNRIVLASPGEKLGREGFAFEKNLFYFLPADFPGARLLVFPEPAEAGDRAGQSSPP